MNLHRHAPLAALLGAALLLAAPLGAAPAAAAPKPPAAAVAPAAAVSSVKSRQDYEAGDPTYGETRRGNRDAGLRCRACGTRIDAPFPLVVYGEQYSSVYVTASGTAQLGASADPAPIRSCLPAKQFSGPVLFALWDDMDTGHDDAGGVFTAVSGAAPSREFTVEWRHAYSASDHSWHDFSMTIAEGNGLVTYDYGPHEQFGESGPWPRGAQNGDGSAFTQQGWCNLGGLAFAELTLRPVAGPTTASRPVQVQVTAESGTGEATVSWSSPQDEGGTPVTGYQLHWGGGGQPSYSPVLPPTTRSFTVTGLTQNTYETFFVTALNARGSGEEGWAEVLVTPPAAPEAVLGSVDADTGTLTWQPPAAQTGAWVSGYRITRSGTDLAGHGPVTVRRDAGARRQDFTGLRPGTEYVLTVQALSASGAGPARTVRVTVPRRPFPPRIGVAAPGTPGGALTASVTWQPPMADGGSAVTGYVVRAQRRVATRTVETIYSTTLPTGARSAALSLPHSGNWRFAVQAVNAQGTSPASVYSNTVLGQ